MASVPSHIAQITNLVTQGSLKYIAFDVQATQSNGYEPPSSTAKYTAFECTFAKGQPYADFCAKFFPLAGRKLVDFEVEHETSSEIDVFFQVLH